MANKFWEAVSHEFQRGWATIEAEFRRGLKDAQNAVLNPWNGFVATHEEAGTIGSPTQAQITNDLQGNRGRDGRGRSASRADDVQPVTPVMTADADKSSSPSILQERMNQVAEMAAEPAPPDRDLDLDR